ncbi:MAG: type II toxin-antitoxin system PemK/MazF family toxin [Dehalococcoidia bacterium]
MHVPLTPPEGGLRVPSALLCDQVRALSRQRLIERWGRLSPATVREVEMRVRTLLRL